MSQQRLSETALKLLELAKPRYIKGRWRKPLISNRELAVSRKALLLQGEYWPPKPLVNRGADKPLKLHAWERGRTRWGTKPASGTGASVVQVINAKPRPYSVVSNAGKRSSKKTWQRCPRWSPSIVEAFMNCGRIPEQRRNSQKRMSICMQQARSSYLANRWRRRKGRRRLKGRNGARNNTNYRSHF